MIQESNRESRKKRTEMKKAKRKKERKLKHLFYCDMRRRRKNQGLSGEELSVSFVQAASSTLPASFDGFRIVHLSDLHGTLYGRRHRRLMKEIAQAEPDAVMMTGDMMDHKVRGMVQLVDLCGQMCRHWPVYYVPGNHEQCLKRQARDSLWKKLKGIGVIILENQCCPVSRGEDSMDVYGLVTPMVYYKDLRMGVQRKICFTAEDAERLLGKPEPSRYSLLLSHNPLYFPAYRDWGADLTLSGHIHGGVIRIPGLGGLLSPELRFFPRYDAGHFEERGKHLVVSRGLGNNFLFRIANPPEVVVITLVRKAGKEG